MEQFFNSINGIDFGKRFTSNDDCCEYLYQIKWQDGYRCRICQHSKYGKGRTRFYRRCQKCMYDESVICNTMFANTRMPLLKAFHMVFRTVSKKKGISSYELGTEVGVQQKTAWKFKLKIKNAMIQAEENATKEKEAAKTQAGSRVEEDGQEKPDAPTIDHGLEIEVVSQVQSMPEAEPQLAKKATPGQGDETAGTAEPDDLKNTPASTGKIPTYTGPPIPWSKLKGMPGYMISLHLWLRGIHHHHSKKYESTYYDEYFYRLNNRHDREPLFHRTLIRFVQANPKTYRDLTAPREHNGSLNSILMHKKSNVECSPKTEPA